MNTIQNELELAKCKMIKTVKYKNMELAELTRENIAIVEAMICNDSAYSRSSDVNAKPEYKNNKSIKYGGSTAYWMTQLKYILKFENQKVEHSYEKIIEGAVESVDRENNTHLNADRCRQEIINRIQTINQEKLIRCLKEPDYENMFLINEISRRTSAKYRARCNISFASKFCHYACFYVFEGEEYQDNYPVYDSILRKVLPAYLDYFEIKQKFDLNNYKQYREAVDKVIKSSKTEISRNGFDHLLWYYHKGRKIS